MKKVSFTKAGLESYLLTSPKLGEEICAIEDKRWRAWSRKKGVVLGFEIHVDGKRLRQTVGVYGDISITTFKEQVSRIFAEKQLNGIATTAQTLTQYFESTYLAYSKTNHRDQKATLCNWGRLSIELKSKKLGAIKREHIQAELQRISDRGLSNASVNRTRAFLSSIFRLAVADDLLLKSPVTHVKAKHEQIMPAVSLSDAVYARYVELAMSADNAVHGCALALAALSGARISEVRGIKLSNIPTDCSSFIVEGTKNGDVRTVHVSATGAKVLKLAMQLSSNEYLFSSDLTDCKYISYPRYTHDRIISQMLKEGVIEKPFLVKALRSTVGTKIFEATGSLENVRRVLGHRSYSVASAHYLHPRQEHFQEVVSVLENSLKAA